MTHPSGCWQLAKHSFHHETLLGAKHKFWRLLSCWWHVCVLFSLMSTAVELQCQRKIFPGKGQEWSLFVSKCSKRLYNNIQTSRSLKLVVNGLWDTFFKQLHFACCVNSARHAVHICHHRTLLRAELLWQLHCSFADLFIPSEGVYRIFCTANCV